MCGALWIDIGEFPQTVRRVARWDQATFEVFQRFPAASVYLYVSDADALYAEWKALENLEAA